MTTQYRLSPKDQERLGLDGWITDNREALDDIPFSVLMEWERELAPLKVAVILGEWDEKSAVGIAGYLWLCLKVAGGACPAWSDFEIRTTGVKQKVDKSAPLSEDSSTPSPVVAESQPA